MSVLRVISGPAKGSSHPLDADVIIGRENADLTIDDGEMSRRHAAIRPSGGGVVVEDLDSMNGTFVEGRRISAPVTLTETTTIRVGKSELSVELTVAQPADKPIVDIQQDTRARDVPVVDVDQATRARDVPVADVDEATRARDVPVADVDDSTRARDVPVADVDDATRARDVPVADLEQATRARDVPVADVAQSTRARDVPVADVAQPTTARSTTPAASQKDTSGGPLATTIGGIPVLVFGLLGLILLVVIIALLLG